VWVEREVLNIKARGKAFGRRTLNAEVQSNIRKNVILKNIYY
jgi:hypothetical protein